MRGLWIAALLGVSCAAQNIDFAKDVAPVLVEQCLACHSAGKAAGGVALSSREVLIARKAIVPGNPEASPLYRLSALPSSQPGAMPPGGPRLPDDQLAILKRWIVQGAPWPKGMALASTTRTAPADEHDTVRRIRQRILDHQSAAAKSGRYSVTIPNTTVSFQMVPIPAGEFEMGSTSKPDEQPQHKVRVDAFWMQAHEVTWDEYRLFMFSQQSGKVATADGLVDAIAGPTRPYVEMSFGMGIDGFPAISMTQHAANKYAEWLSAKTGEFYRLPTEAEWEYACRANSPAPELAGHAWYGANSEGKYHNVATTQPNAWGLYDMLGNVMEWTLDQYAPYPAAAQANPWVKATAPYPQVARGGSWNDEAGAIRCTARVASDATWKQQDPQLPKSIWYLTDAQWLGFRLVRPAKIPNAGEMFGYWNSGVEHDEQ